MTIMTEHPEGWFRAYSALVAADVTIGRLSSLWFNVVVRGDVAPIIIGSKVNAQDGVVIHADTGTPNVIEDQVSIGHGAVIHGARIGRDTLIGMRAVVLGGVCVGAECIIAAGAVLSPGMQVPDRSVVMGVPGRVVRPVTDQEVNYTRWISGHYVELARRYARGAYAALAGTSDQ